MSLLPNDLYSLLPFFYTDTKTRTIPDEEFCSYSAIGFAGSLAHKLTR